MERPLSELTIADLKKLSEQGTPAIIDGDKRVIVIEKRDGRPKGGTEQEDPPGV